MTARGPHHPARRPRRPQQAASTPRRPASVSRRGRPEAGRPHSSEPAGSVWLSHPAGGTRMARDPEPGGIVRDGPRDGREWSRSRPRGWTMRLRQIAPVELVLGLTIAGFFGTILLGERDASIGSQHRAEVAAVQIRERVEQGSSLAESLRRLMESLAGYQFPSAEFQSNASRWLIPGFSAAAWVEQVPASQRAAYERRTGNSIVAQDRQPLSPASLPWRCPAPILAANQAWLRR